MRRGGWGGAGRGGAWGHMGKSNPIKINKKTRKKYSLLFLIIWKIFIYFYLFILIFHVNTTALKTPQNGRNESRVWRKMKAKKALNLWNEWTVWSFWPRSKTFPTKRLGFQLEDGGWGIKDKWGAQALDWNSEPNKGRQRPSTHPSNHPNHPIVRMRLRAQHASSKQCSPRGVGMTSVVCGKKWPQTPPQPSPLPGWRPKTATLGPATKLVLAS